MAEQYAPTEEGMKFAFVHAATEESDYWDSMAEEVAEARWDAFIAQVRRDAASEAWDECADEAFNLGHLHGPACTEMTNRNPHRTEQTHD